MGNKVTAAKPKLGGAVYTAPAGTTLPTSASSTLTDDFKALGYISDAGLVNSNNIETDSVKSWGGDEVLVTYQGREDSFKYTLIEGLNLEVLKEVYGAENVTGTLTEGIKINVKSNIELPEKVYVVDMIMKDGVLKRIVIPCGRVENVGDITYADNSAVGYETTLKATPDTSGNTHYEYIAEPSNG